MEPLFPLLLLGLPPEPLQQHAAGQVQAVPEPQEPRPPSLRAELVAHRRHPRLQACWDRSGWWRTDRRARNAIQHRICLLVEVRLDCC
jgi:hypothetical protein